MNYANDFEDQPLIFAFFILWFLFFYLLNLPACKIAQFEIIREVQTSMLEGHAWGKQNCTKIAILFLLVNFTCCNSDEPIIFV